MIRSMLVGRLQAHLLPHIYLGKEILGAGGAHDREKDNTSLISCPPAPGHSSVAHFLQASALPV